MSGRANVALRAPLVPADGLAMHPRAPSARCDTSSDGGTARVASCFTGARPAGAQRLRGSGCLAGNRTVVIDNPGTRA